jgi:hypothetical protein
MENETRIFYRESDLVTALENCQKEGYRPMFMPELADTRIQNGIWDESTGFEQLGYWKHRMRDMWENHVCTQSVMATGRTKQGNAVVVYAHIPNYFSNPANIRKAVSEGLVNGAGRMSQEEFQKLLDAEDNEKVFVVDRKKLIRHPSGMVDNEHALEHPQVIPFFGGKERAEKYLVKRDPQRFCDDIGIHYIADLRENPLCRFLSLDYHLGDSEICATTSINESDNSRGSGFFCRAILGVRDAKPRNTER